LRHGDEKLPCYGYTYTTILAPAAQL